MRAAISTIVMVLGVSSVGPQPRPYRPMPFPLVDEARDNPELAAFRRAVFDVAKRQNLDELVSMSSSTKTDVGEVPANLGRLLFTGVNDPPWGALAEALSFGGSFTTTCGAIKRRREFCAPYVYSAYPKTLPNELEGENLPWAIVHEHTRVRVSADPSSRTLGTLEPSLVGFIDRIEPDVFSFKQRAPGWVLIQFSPKRQGYVDWKDARSPDDWHVCMALEEAGWRITAFDVHEFIQH